MVTAAAGNGRKPAAKRKGTANRRAKAMDAKAFARRFGEIQANIESVVRGKEEVVRLALVAVLSEGHVLLEDMPGTGKSVLARAIAQSIDATTARIQCTPDMLPADITGAAVLERRTGALEFRPGPVFSNVLLADEINRATPKTQSALLEAMQERRVSVDGVTHELPRPFVVLATQNPVETAGTFPLPEAQLDRFLFRLSLGHLDRDHELEVMFANSRGLAIEELGAVVNTREVSEMIKAAGDVKAAEDVGYYIVDLVQATRDDPAVLMGGSSRAAIALVRAARVLAASDGRGHVYPDDVLTVLGPVLEHRVVLKPDAVLRGETAAEVVARAVSLVRSPVMSGAGSRA